MQIYFTTRELARKHAAKRKAHGKPAKIVDRGVQEKPQVKRYAVELRA